MQLYPWILRTDQLYYPTLRQFSRFDCEVDVAFQTQLRLEVLRIYKEYEIGGRCRSLTLTVSLVLYILKIFC